MTNIRFGIREGVIIKKKHNMYQNNNNGLKPLRCFVVRYNGYRAPCGYNLDFLSCELISDLISEIDTG